MVYPRVKVEKYFDNKIAIRQSASLVVSMSIEQAKQLIVDLECITLDRPLNIYSSYDEVVD